MKGKKQRQQLSANMEDYLEAIAVLQEKNTVARVRDISHMLKVKTSSVTAALMTLSRAALVKHERYGYVELTPHGKQRARDIQKRHDLLIAFLTKVLHIDNDIAAIDACKMEHAMSKETFKRLALFIEYFEKRSQKKHPHWLNQVVSSL